MQTDLQVIQHIRRMWPFNVMKELVVDDPLLQRIVDDLKIIQVAPLIPATGVWAYITVGLSLVQVAPFCKEFILLSPKAEPQHVRTLTEVAFRHAVPGNPLSLGDTVILDRPWVSGSVSDCLLVSRPYILDPSIEYFSIGEVRLQYLWLFPITPLEREFLEENGLEALEQQFDKRRVKPLDPNRESVV